MPSKILISQNFQQFTQEFPSILLQPIQNTKPVVGATEQLANFFEINTLPVAELGALGADLHGKGEYWLRADPVELYADLAQVYLVGNKHLDLKPDEIEALKTYLNEHFKTENMQLFIEKNNEWYLNLNFKPELKTFSTLQVEGKNIYNFLPTGQQKNFWQKWLTEVQMLLQSAPINQQRKAQKQPQINSLWLWGEGDLADFKVKQENIHIISNNHVALGVAKYLNWQFEKFNHLIENFLQNDYLFIINPELDDKGLIMEQFEIFKKHDATVEFLDGKVCKLKKKWQKILNFLSSRTK